MWCARNYNGKKASRREGADVKKLRFITDEVANLQVKLALAPFEGKFAPRETTSVMPGTAWVYPSRSRENHEYRAIVHQDEEQGWCGMCSCRGWAQLKRAEGATKACGHIFDALMRHPGFKLSEVMGETEAEAAAEKAHVRQMKALAKAALAGRAMARAV